jgi:hypothetical protein
LAHISPHRRSQRLLPGPPDAARLHYSWSRRLDGQVYAFSLVTHGLAWHSGLGIPEPRASLPCGNIAPSVGITDTPVYDRATGSIFAFAETTGGSHTLFAIAISTGRIRWHRIFDITGRDRKAEQQRAALAVANGRVYVPFGGLYGDCGNYVGYLASWATSGVGTMTKYIVPTKREGGVWTPSGPAVGTDGNLYVSVGNGASSAPLWDGSDSAIRLSPNLIRRDDFVPSNSPSENARDLDLGSSGPLLLPAGRALISGKAGDVFLLNTGLGHLRTPLAHLSGCAAYGGSAYDPIQRAAFLPCESGLHRSNVIVGTMAGFTVLRTN